MRILWTSNSAWANTGYGVQTRLFTPRIRDLGHEMGIFAFYGVEGGVLTWNGMPVFPRAYHPYGVDIMGAHAVNFGADIAISLIDAWVMRPEMMHGTKWVPWFPIDSEPAAHVIIEKVAKAYRRIVFSRFGERMVNNAGLDCYYVPHGVDTQAYHPTGMVEARERAGLPQDAYIVGMVAANKGNPSRKAFYQQIVAFANFHRRHTDTVLYIHSCKGENGENDGVNLVRLVEGNGLTVGKDVLFADQYAYTIGGYGDEDMNALYNSMNVHLLVSTGEGFGVPIIEAQAAGCPVIVGDWTAMGELCFSGTKVSKEDADPVYSPLDNCYFAPRIRPIELALEAEYKKPSSRERARREVMAYDVDTVTQQYWKPVLEDIAASVERWKALSVPAVPAHAHEWHGVGLFNADGSMSVPCKECGAELVMRNGKQERIIEGGFTNPLGLKFCEPDGLEWLLLREVERDYQITGLNAESTVVDIGAHVGVVSMTLAKRFGCQVWAFEPNKDNFSRLVANTVTNDLDPQVQCFQYAVTGDGRKVHVETNINNSGGGNIYAGGKGDTGSVTLAFILKEVGGTIDLLKIDCEGAEYEILADTESLKHVKAIRGEFHRAFGDADALLERVRAVVPDTIVTIQGSA